LKNAITGLAAAGLLALGAGFALADGHTKYAGDSYSGWEWYVELVAGGPIPKDYDNTIGTIGPTVYDPDSGFGFGALAGFYFAENMRADVSFTYGNVGEGVLTVNATGAVLPHAGDVNGYNVLFNAYYEFDELAGLPLTPWIGVGVGFQTYDYDNLGAIGGAFVINDSDTVFTGALHAGFDYALTSNFDLVGRYSLVLVGDHDVVTSTGLPVAVDGGVENAFFGGIRFKLPPM
jgi:hypothetical protein